MRRGATLLIGVLLVLVLVGVRPAAAQRVTFEAMAGSAYNFPTPLTIQQGDFPEIRFTAHYATKPFGPYAPYYSWRLSLHDTHGAWEIQQVHHRLFLTNTTPDVSYFAIHFGYNYFMAGRAWQVRGFVLHTDAGLLVTNPDNIVRGLHLNAGNAGPFDVGYRLSGPCGAVAVSRIKAITTHFYLLADGGLLFGHATVPVAEGSASVPNVGLHGHVGVGFGF